MTDLLQFTINLRQSHRQPQRTSQLVCEGRLVRFELSNIYCELQKHYHFCVTNMLFKHKLKLKY
jgi:hypothetical protein